MALPTEQFGLIDDPLIPSSGEESRSLQSTARYRGERASQTGQEVVALIVRLELMARTELPAQQRIALMKAIKPRIRGVAAEMSKPVAAARLPEDRTEAQTLEQRLYWLGAKNLKLALEDLDRSLHALSDEAADQRRWLVKSLFRFFGWSVEYCVRWDRAWPPHLWEQLHETFYYMVMRVDVRVGSRSTGDFGEFNPERSYKRLLLLGLIHGCVPVRYRARVLANAVDLWAVRSRLHHPESFAGVFGLYVVEISRDSPPWELPGSLMPQFNGWVFEPAPAFLEFLTSLRSATVPLWGAAPARTV